MSTTSAKKIISAPVLGAVSNTQPIGQFSYCSYCNDPAGLFSPALIYPYFPSDPVRCQSCGNMDDEIHSFNLINPQRTRIASPSFPTIGEVNHFGKIFGMSGFYLIELRSFFIGESDAERRKESLNRLAGGRKVYELLLEHMPENPDKETLKQLAQSLRLENYALPQFLDDYNKVGAA